MSNTSADGTERDGHRLLEDVLLLNGAVDDALYRAVKYNQKPEYDHIREDTLDEIRAIRELADEILERELTSETER